MRVEEKNYATAMLLLHDTMVEQKSIKNEQTYTSFLPL